MIKDQLNEMAEHIPITWDRFIDSPGFVTIYGWLERSDGKRDFIIILMSKLSETLIFYATSSIKYSQAIQDYLGVAPEDHNDCQLFENMNL